MRSSIFITDTRVFERGGVLRNPAVLQPGLIGPFVRVLRLPRPHDPPARLFVRDHLSFPRLSQERLEALTERCARSSLSLAAADVGRSRERAVVSRADAPSVEVLGAVRHGRCPLPNDGPQLVIIKVLEITTLAACSGYVLRLRLRYGLAYQAMLPTPSGTPLKGSTHLKRFYLVNVGIKGHSLVLRWALPSIPITERLEGIMDHF